MHVLKKYFCAAQVCIIIVLIMQLPFHGSAAGTENFSGSTVLGIQGGPSFPGGYYEQKLNTGISGGIFFLPYISSLFMIEGSLAASYYSIQGSEKSALYDVSAGAGLLLYYPLFSFFMPYGGASLSAHYIRFEADLSGRTEDTWKPGYFIKAGAFIPFSERIVCRIGAEYCEHDLSDKTFRSIQLMCGISYRMRPELPVSVKSVRELRDDEAGRLYHKGIKEFSDRNPFAAEVYFREVLNRTHNYKDTEQYIERINHIRNMYSAAVAAEEKGDLFFALEKYDGIDNALKDAEHRRNILRKKLLHLVPEMEKNGVKAYHGGEYGKCITVMKRVLLILPESRKAEMYLKRAMQNRQALRKLQ